MSRKVNRETYFLELAETSRSYYIDYLSRFIDIDSNTRILEIGCGEGGNLLPFAELGCYVEGLDLAEGKIRNAKSYFEKRNAKGVFYCKNFLDATPPEDNELFDIILLHDVIEHIEPEYKNTFISGIRKYLKKDGIAFIAFPAWQMPFGGHQQICTSSICSALPFAHLLPSGIYRTYLELFKEKTYHVEELLSIKRSKVTIESFEKLCSDTNFKILDRTLWFISPHYKAKFNLRPSRLWGWIGNIPYLRNFFSTTCFYILSE